MSEILVWVFIVLLIAFLGYFLLCALGHRTLLRGGEKFGAQLRELEQQLRQLEVLRRSYDSYQDEPFVTSLSDIDAEIDLMHQQMKAVIQKYIDYREWLTGWRNSPWWDFRIRWNYQTIRHLRGAWRENLDSLQTLRQRVEKLAERFDQIKEFPWSIALQSREVMDYLQQAKFLLKELATYGLRGQAYSALIDQVREVEEETKQIPVYFLSDPYEKLLAESAREDIREVYRIVQKNLPLIVAAIHQADQWRNQILTLEQQNQLTQNELERTEQLLAFFPLEVDLTVEKRNLEGFKKKLGELIEKRNNLDVGEMTQLGNELSNLMYELKKTQSLIRQNRQYLSQFQRSMQAIAELTDQIQTRMKGIDQSQFKVEWNLNGEPFQQALKAYQNLCSLKQPYSFQTLRKMVADSALLQTSLIELNRQTARVADLHQAWERLINTPEIKDAPQWIEAARNLAEAIRPYDPRNWPNREWVLSFEKTLLELETNYRQLLGKVHQKALPENTLEELVRELEGFYRQSLSFRERLNVIEQVLHNLFKVEKRGLALLKTSRNQFAQITLFVLSQPLLAEKVEKEIVQFDRRFDLCESAFRQREKDTLARKQAKLQQLISDVEQAANRWMSIVEADCLKLLNEIEQKINRFDQIAQFEDALLYRAREILARKNEIFDFRRTARVHVPMDQLVAAMKKVFDTWQESYAVNRQLAEQVEAPLLSVYQEFQTLQREVHAKVSELEKLIPAQRKWPPNSLLLTVERNEMAQLDERWRTIQSQPISAIQFVRSLSELSAGYRSLLEKFLQYEQWARQEQARIERIEADLSRLDRLWEIQQRRYSQVPEIEGQIRDLRQEVQREIASLRQYWLTNASRRPPSVDYDIVLRKLIELSRQLANARVIVFNDHGEQQMMDINGQVIRKT